MRHGWLAVVVGLGIGLGGCDDGEPSAVDAGGAVDVGLVDMAGDDGEPDTTAPDAAALDAALLDAALPDAAAPDAGPPFRPRPPNPPASTLMAPRGYTLARGLIHMHSVYSHDACDGEPLGEDGTPNWPCHQRFRDAMCHNRHDFVLMTDHPDSVGERTLEEALYHREGDTLELLDGAPVANRFPCPDGHSVLLTAGSEGDMMPVMFRAMPERALLRDMTPEGIARLRDEGGALVLQAHMERFTGEEASVWGLDGQEIYNIHANIDPAGPMFRDVLGDITRLITAGFAGPHPDLWFLALFRPGVAALANYDWTIARRRMPGFAGSDTHENVPLPIETGDGERVESYRRITGWFSNRMLLSGPVSYATVREALVEGRLYVVFDALGLADGFDYRAEAGDGSVVEMGAELAYDPAVTLVVDPPRAPAEDVVELRLLRVTEAGVEPVLVTTDPTARLAAPGPGAYRVEVWVTANHLRPEMGTLADTFIKPQVWIYSNPVYLR